MVFFKLSKTDVPPSNENCGVSWKSINFKFFLTRCLISQILSNLSNFANLFKENA